MILRNSFGKILCLIAVAAIGLLFIKKNKYFKEIVDRLKISIPIGGRIVKNIITYKFSSTLCIMMKSGVHLREGIYNASEVVDNVYVFKGLKMVIEGIDNGYTISEGLKWSNIFDEMFISMIDIGEETGKLCTVFENAANIYEKEINRDIIKLISYIEPIIITFVCLIVGIVIIICFLPIINMYNLSPFIG